MGLSTASGDWGVQQPLTPEYTTKFLPNRLQGTFWCPPPSLQRGSGSKKPFFLQILPQKKPLGDPPGLGQPFNGRRAPRRHAPLAAADWLRGGKGGGAAPRAGKALREKGLRRHFVPWRDRGEPGVPGGSGPSLGPAATPGASGGFVLAAVGVSHRVLQPLSRAGLVQRCFSSWSW